MKKNISRSPECPNCYLGESVPELVDVRAEIQSCTSHEFVDMTNAISSIVVMMLAGQVTATFQPTKHTQTQSLLQYAMMNQKESSSQWALLTRLA